MQITEIYTQKYKMPSESEKAKAKEKMEKMRKEGEKLMKGMFEFIDAPGGWLEFNYRFFPGEPVRRVRIVHGEITDMPMILVKHLNNIWKKVRVMPENNPLELDENGNPKKRMPMEKFSRTRFTPIDAF